MRDYRELKVWQKAHELALAVYRITNRFPRNEQYGLTSQVRRAATSIPTNIAEGCGRSGEKELQRFLAIAAGSASEVEYQLLLCRDLGYLSATEYSSLAESAVAIKKMLRSLSDKLTANS